MRTGKVVRPIVAAKRLWDTPNGALLVVELDPPPAWDEGSATSRRTTKVDKPPREQLVALDTLGCGTDERVLVATGSVAAAWFAGKPPPVDALIIASLAK